MTKTSGKLTLRDILKNVQLMFLKTVKVIENKKHLRNCHRSQSSRETCQPNMIGVLDGVLEQEKYIKENWWNLNKMQDLINSNVSILAP